METLKCVSCEKDLPVPIKKWKYAAFDVELYRCDVCNKSFKAYFFDDKLSHIISTNMSTKTKIRKYLETHCVARSDEIAEALHLKIIDVLDALSELQKLGVVEGLQHTSK